ncbi:MAG: hypothetical protein HYV26_20020 [Candidatus Hydrogenedentes bacterium]|nr:hypothetical protein [Candidatus Hydrogenedentota bacterium]
MDQVNPIEAVQKAIDTPLSVPDFAPWGRFLRRCIIAGFRIQLRLAARMQVTGLANVVNAPGTLVMMGHKSELDGVLLAPLLAAQGGPIGACAYLAGEHVFQPWFISGWALKKPRWLCWLLLPLKLDKLMAGMRVIPVPMARERFLLSHLIDLLEHEGDLPLRHLFEQPPPAHLPGVAPDARVRSVLVWKYIDPLFALAPFSWFKQPYKQALWGRHEARILRMIKAAVSVLDSGGALVILPEGLLSEDGKLRRIKSGVTQILKATRDQVVVQPMGVTYDYMTTGRFHAYVNFGPAVYGANSWNTEETRVQTACMLSRLTTVTLAQLVSQALFKEERDNRDSRDERDKESRGDPVQEEALEVKLAVLRSAVAAAARSCAAAGLLVDEELLEASAFDRRWRRFLRYCERHGFLDRHAGRLRVNLRETWKGKHPATWTVSPWEYHRNEFQALCEAHGVDLSAQRTK